MKSGILHAFFDNPLQSVLHGFGGEELVLNIFRVNEETDLKDYRQAQSGGTGSCGSCGKLTL